MWRRSADTGIGFWPNDIFDGRYLEAIKEGYRVVAGVEDFYAEPALPENSFKAVCRNVMEFDAVGSNGESVKLTMPQLDRKIRVLRHRRNGTELLTLFNFSDTLPAIVELALRCGGDFYSCLRSLPDGSGLPKTERFSPGGA